MIAEGINLIPCQAVKVKCKEKTHHQDTKDVKFHQARQEIEINLVLPGVLCVLVVVFIRFIHPDPLLRECLHV
jgi:hypothetical protein